MINGFEGYTDELSDHEKELLPAFIAGLKNKVGKENAITNKAIQKAFQENDKWNISIPDARVRKIINFIRIKGLVPGLCASSNGYYVAKDQEEYTAYMEGLNDRIQAQIAVWDALKKQYPTWQRQNK